MFKELEGTRSTVYEQIENIEKEKGRKNHILEAKIQITKSSPEGFGGMFGWAGASGREDRFIEMSQSEEQKGKRATEK